MGMFWGVIFSTGVPKQLAPNDGTDSQALPLDEFYLPPTTLPPWLLRAWQPEVRVTILRAPGGGGVDDTPPRSRASDQIIRNAWRQDWLAQGGERNAGLVGIDNPPLEQSYGAPNTVRQAWQQTWSAQTGERSAAWDPGIPSDNPPPKALTLAPWANQTWTAQRAPAGAAWDAGIASDPPPPFVRQLPQIQAAWQPNYSVTFLRPTGGGDVAVVDNPPLRETSVPPQIAQAWQQTWVAQSSTRSINWNVDAPLPRGLPRVDALWQVSWPAQGPGKTSAWNVPAAQVDNPPPHQDYAKQQIATSWYSGWLAQSAQKSAAWNFVVAAVDNPPPLKAYPSQVFSAWQPNVTVVFLRPTGGPSVAAAGDDPPFRQDFDQQKITALWRQDWAAQSAPKNAAWNFVLATPDNPPFGGRRRSAAESWYATWKSLDVRTGSGASIGVDDPPPLNRNWLYALIAQGYPPVQQYKVAGGSGQTTASDDPPPEQDYGVFKTLAKWGQTWPAQRATRSAAWDFQPPVVDNPPPRTVVPVAINASWQSAWAAQRPDLNAAWNVDNPPPAQDYARQQVVGMWVQDWTAQSAPKSAAWNFVSPDNPQPRQDYAKQQIVSLWQMWWPAQGPSKNAAWNYVTPDNPPPSQSFARQQINAAWQSNWLAQSSPKDAAWNVRPPDNPPPHHDYGAPRVVAAWQMSWAAQGSPWTVVPPDALTYDPTRRYVVVGDIRIFIVKGDERKLS